MYGEFCIGLRPQARAGGHLERVLRVCVADLGGLPLD